MPYKLFLLCSLVLLGRPQDILTFLLPLRLGLVLTLLSIAAMVFGGRRQELTAALSTPESKRYLLFYLIMIVGVPFATHRGSAFQGVFEWYFVNVFFFVFLVSQVTSLQRLKALVWVSCLSTAMYSVFGGILQSGEGRFAVFSSALDPNDTAFVLLALFPLCLYFLRFDEGLLKRFVAVAAILGSIATILLTGSRGGMLGFGTVLLIMLFTNTGGIKKSHKMLLIIMLASASVLMSDKIDVGRYLTLFDLSSDYNLTDEGGRIVIWQGAIDLTLAHPITGVGVECFPFAYFLVLQNAGKALLLWHTVHNSYLQVACEVGLIGFAIFASIILRSLFTLFRMSRAQARPESREADELRALAGLMVLGFSGVLVSGFFLSQGYSIFYTLYFALAATMRRLEAGISADLSSASLKARTEWSARAST